MVCAPANHLPRQGNLAMQPLVCGGSVTAAFAFLNDATLAVATSRGVAAYSAENAELIARIPAPPGAVALAPLDTNRLYAVSPDGAVALCSIRPPAVLATWAVGAAPTRVHHHGATFYYECADRTLAFPLHPDTPRVRVAACGSGTPSCDGRVVYTASGATVTATDCATGERLTGTVAFPRPGAIARLIPHPSDARRVFALDTIGRATLWDFGGLGRGGRVAPPAVFHWHAQGVTCGAAAQGGSVLLTGGLEHVVVVWNVGTGQKAFVDVGAAIVTLCVTESGTRAAAGLATNAIAVVDVATRRVVCRVSGVLGAGGLTAVAAPGGLLALHGQSPTLQVYDPVTDRSVERADVVRGSAVGWTLDGRSLGDTELRHVAYADGGAWLVAYDVRTAGGYRETHLRFFRRRGDGRHEEVLTVPDPFEGDVTGIAASPTGRVVVTTSTDRTFKVWVRCRRGRGTETWKCRSVGAFRGEASSCASFSGDGSAVAVGFRTAVTVWDVGTNRLVCAIPQAGGRVAGVAFLDGQRVLAVGSRQAAVWDVGARSVVLGLVVGSPLYAADGTSGRFAVTRRRGRGVDVLLFGRGSGRPAACWRVGCGVAQLVFYRAGTGASFLVCVCDDGRLVLLPLDGLSAGPVESGGAAEGPRRGISLRGVSAGASTGSVALRGVDGSVLDAVEANALDGEEAFDVVVEALLI